MPVGAENWPSPVPVAPIVCRLAPVELNLKTRLAAWSTVKTLPEASTATLIGSLRVAPVASRTKRSDSLETVSRNSARRWPALSVTQSIPPGAETTPSGAVNSVPLEPAVALVPNFWMNSPLELNCCRRLLPVSATQMLPAAVTVIPQGSENWPLPVPAEPNLPRYWPVSENSSTRLLARSTIQTCPLPSAATPRGPFSWPSPEPAEPKAATKIGFTGGATEAPSPKVAGSSTAISESSPPW